MKRFSIDYSDLYGGQELVRKHYEEDIAKKIEGEVEEKDKICIPRAQLMQEVKTKFVKNKDLSVWELGYWSTD